MKAMRVTSRTRRTRRIPPVTQVDEPHTLSVDLTVYSLNCIKRSAYRFTDRFALDLKIDGNQAVCVFSFDSKLSNDAQAAVIGQFQKEMLDQDLRESIREETKDVRNLILAHAFSRTGLINDVSLPAD